MPMVEFGPDRVPTNPTLMDSFVEQAVISINSITKVKKSILLRIKFLLYKYTLYVPISLGGSVKKIRDKLYECLPNEWVKYPVERAVHFFIIRGLAMKFKQVIESLSTVTDLKRVASAYVIDYRNLSNDEVCEALMKTAPQYYYRENLESTLDDLMLSESRDERILAPVILKYVLLHTDDFKIVQKELSDAIIDYEQSIINSSNDVLSMKDKERSKNLEFFKFVLEAAWDRNDDISADEKNLLNKIRVKLNITEDESHMLEATIGKFPVAGNRVHTRDQIECVRRKLQTVGILFSVRDNEKNDYDVIPEEIASVLREMFGYEIKHHGYVELLENKHVRSKSYLKGLLIKGGVTVSNSAKTDEIKKLCLSYLSPSILLGGYTPRDGIDSNTLSKWCSELGLQVSGQKQELINRIIGYYDNIRKEIQSLDDERTIWYEFYEDLASRKLDNLRSQNIILKDIECEKKFEQATDYIFEELLVHKPLVLKGTEHADGMLSYQEKVIMWDNKSKETSVNLTDHIKQFDRYIKSADKSVPIFLVIGPSFTENSTSVAMQYMLENETIITLITADELKTVAEKWSKTNSSGNDPFPLGYFKQPGRFNIDLVSM